MLLNAEFDTPVTYNIPCFTKTLQQHQYRSKSDFQFISHNFQFLIKIIIEKCNKQSGRES
jgi:hypothetical protein